MRTIQGSCHCGNIQFTFQRPDNGDAPIPGRACGCTFCQKHGGLYTSHPQGELQATVKDNALLNKYRFGTKTADFYTCANCGVVPFVVSEIEGNDYAVVSVRAFDGVASSEIDTAPADFDGEGTGGRLERRTRTWIPLVYIG